MKWKRKCTSSVLCRSAQKILYIIYCEILLYYCSFFMGILGPGQQLSVWHMTSSLCWVFYQSRSLLTQPVNPSRSNKILTRSSLGAVTVDDHNASCLQTRPFNLQVLTYWWGPSRLGCMACTSPWKFAFLFFFFCSYLRILLDYFYLLQLYMR